MTMILAMKVDKIVKKFAILPVVIQYKK